MTPSGTIEAVPDYYVPKRRPEGGMRISFWANTAELAALKAYAASIGVSVHQAARKLMADGLAALKDQEAKR